MPLNRTPLKWSFIFFQLINNLYLFKYSALVVVISTSLGLVEGNIFIYTDGKCIGTLDKSIC